MVELKEEKYRLLLQQVDGLINANEPIVTNLANIAAALKQTFEKISWVGFYLLKGNKLFLGPFQGKVACTKIDLGRGVCGTSAEAKKSIIVPNVDKYPGHIACDVESKSEIVVPLLKNENLFGVLDLDSTELTTFDEIDKKWLEEICKLTVNKLDLSYSILV